MRTAWCGASAVGESGRGGAPETVTRRWPGWVRGGSGNVDRSNEVASALRAGGIGSRRTVALVGGLLLLLGASWLMTAARLTAPFYVVDPSGERQQTVAPEALAQWWQLLVAPASAAATLAIAGWRFGWRSAASSAAAALVIGLLLFQVHAGFRLSYTDGDVPRDGLIYNTTSPDVQRMMADLERLSYEVEGDLGLSIQYGGAVDWPLHWYLRAFGSSFVRSTVQPGIDVPVIVLASQRTPEIAVPEAERARPLLATGYTERRYVLRWHEPESAIYRNFAIAPEIPPGSSAWKDADDPHGPLAILGSVWSSFRTATTPEGQQRLWRIVFYRELPQPPIGYTFSLFIRNDLVPVYDAIHYGPDHAATG